MDKTVWQAAVLDRISRLSKRDWDSCNPNSHPFTSYDFLAALEESDCVKAETGWQPQHMVLKSDKDDIAGVIPMYLKGHSYGEYVFDHSWAAAYERAGGSYYPKLLCGVPFSPVTGPRLLINPAFDNAEINTKMRALPVQFAQQQELSSLHLNFIEEAQANALELEGYLIRHDQQFHFENKNYQHFDDFLASLASRKRKQLKKERASAQSAVTIRHLQGDDISAADWDQFYIFYMDTGLRKWGRPYLNRDFFAALGERMADKCLLVLADDDHGDTIAGALNIIADDVLYGRYWGCTRHINNLHFEVCYYQAIDYAIKHGLKRVEAGAQGQHKLARGYTPTRTYSAHYLPDPGFKEAVARYLEMERREVGLEMDILKDHTPFKKGN